MNRTHRRFSRSSLASSYTRLALAFALACAGLVACGNQDQGVNPQDRLCGGEAGVGLDVDDGAGGFEFCASNAEVATSVDAGGAWDVSARHTAGSRTVTFRMRFVVHLDAPASLNVTSDPAAAAADPDGVWIDWEEVTAAGDTLVTRDALGGSFTLGFSDARAAAGTMSSIRVELRRPGGSSAVATRTIRSGFFSLASGTTTR